MGKFFAEQGSLVAVADAIRAKTGGTEPLVFPGGYISAIGEMSAEERLLAAEFPDYVRTEAAAVAGKVRNVLTDDSVVFVAMSDTHYYGDEGSNSSGIQTNESCLHAAMAVKALTYLLPVDFVGHLGDAAWGGSTTEPQMLQTQIREILADLRESSSVLPVFFAIGNHDTGIYYHDEQIDGDIHTLDGSWLYENFTACSASEDTVFGGEEYGGYCYRDLPEKKLRIFLLNSAEKLVAQQQDSGTLPAQQLWVANALKELGEKEDAADWKFLVLCHYPLDYGDHRPMSNVFKAYVNGESITVAVDGIANTVDFAGRNAPKFALQLHGHIHCFLTERLYGYENAADPMTQYDAWRAAVPNVQFDRENYYDIRDYNGIWYCEENTYPKTADTAKDTAFVVGVLNHNEGKVFLFCYGAGYDRVVSYSGASYYSVVADLTYATLSSSAELIGEGEPYFGTITVEEGCTLQTVTLTMGGEDITEEAYSAEDGTISISSVTGTVCITVTAKAPAVNQISISTDADGDIFGTNGYKTGVRIDSSSNETEVEGMCCTGYIPITTSDTVRIKNVTVSGAASPYIVLYGSSKGFVTVMNVPAADADGVITITPDQWPESAATIQWLRLSVGVIDDTSVITVNE